MSLTHCLLMFNQIIRNIKLSLVRHRGALRLQMIDCVLLSLHRSLLGIMFAGVLLNHSVTDMIFFLFLVM